MSTQSTSVGVGQGNDRQGESSQSESGGSGGAGLTHSISDTHTDQPVEKSNLQKELERDQERNTGLGTPETGANQTEADLAPPRV